MSRAVSDSSRPLLPHYNLVMITLDCVRPDFLGCYGCTSVRTPNLDRLAAGGIVFEQAITQAPNTWVSHAGIFTGLYPPRHGLRSPYERLPPEIPSLASLLAAQGYATAGFPGSGLVGSGTGLEQGFRFFHEAFGDPEGLGEPRPGGQGARVGDPDFAPRPDRQPGQADGSLNQTAVKRGGPVSIQGHSQWDDVLETARHWLSRQQEPVFLWFHYLDTHHLSSFELPDYYRYSREPQWQFYEGKVSYADERCVQGVIDLLRGWGHFEETLIVVLSDHGEGLSPGRPPAHNGELAEEVLRVPLICYCAGALWGGVRRPGLVRTVDLVPTLLEVLCGHNSRAGAGTDTEFSGFPLAFPGLESWSPGAEPGRDCAYAENEPLGIYCLRTCEWKLLVRPEGEELYHLATDPATKANVIGRHPATAAYLRRMLEETRSSGAAAGAPPDRSEQETRRLLRSLGYVE